MPRGMQVLAGRRPGELDPADKIVLDKQRTALGHSAPW